EVLGYEPYEGRREVRLRSGRRVLIRLPQAATRDQAELWVDGVRREPLWRGAYVDAGALGPGQVVELRYPLAEAVEHLEGNRRTLTVRWKGSTVLDVLPVGEAPIPYRRAQLAKAPTPWQSTPTYPLLTKYVRPV